MLSNPSQLQVKPLLQVTRQEEEMSLKEEELKRAKEVSLKYESELKEITLKHTSVMDKVCGRRKRRMSCCLSLDTIVFRLFAIGFGGEKCFAGTTPGRDRALCRS